MGSSVIAENNPRDEDWPAGELLHRKKNPQVLAAGSKQSTMKQCVLSQQENQSIAVNAILMAAQLRGQGR